MKHKSFTITYYHSNIIEEMLFSSEEDAEEFDNILSEYVNNSDAIEEFKNNKYPSLRAIEYAIENDGFVENLYGEYSDGLIEACEKMIGGYNGFTSNDCYKLTFMYVFNKVYRKLNKLTVCSLTHALLGKAPQI